MKNCSLLLAFVLVFALPYFAGAQKDVSKNPFDKKLHLGASLNTYWSTVTGDNLPRPYFTKPSWGFNVRAEYYVTKSIGIGLGIGYQQYGMGIKNPDLDQSPGNTDSTFLERVRLHSIEIPVSILIRSPEVIKGLRLSGSYSVVPIHVFQATDVFQDVNSGNNLETDVSNVYARNDVLMQISMGPEINCGDTGLLQVHFVYAQGTSNVYMVGPGYGLNHSMGLRIAWLFGSRLNVRRATR
ncbi:MAG: outer membrane beta-barrel protein [Cytophagales bacterium]|nr:outer membrane beta-barrel protein [Cytophagales bacterium]